MQILLFALAGAEARRGLPVYASPDKPELNHLAQVSEDGRWVIVTSSSGTEDRYEIKLTGAAAVNSKRRVLSQFRQQSELCRQPRLDLLFHHQHRRPEGADRQPDIAQASPVPVTVFAEDEATLQGADLVGGKLIASYLKDAKSEARVHSPGGAVERTIPLSGIGTASGFDGEYYDPRRFSPSPASTS